MRRLAPVLALGALLLTALPAHAAEAPAHRESYGTKAPYAPRQSPRAYQRPPAGFTPVFTENVSRHGSRAASDGADADLVLALWDRAEAEGQLTGKGEEFGPVVRGLRAAMAKTGYGSLSGRGRQEMADTAVRLERRLPALFRRIADDGEKIDVVSSGQGRAVASGTAFTNALADAEPALKPLIGPVRTDKDLLYFHKAAGGAAYRDYIENDQRLKDTLGGITAGPRTREAAHGILRKIFKEPFVARVDDQVAAARAVYELYAIAPAMSEESPDGGGWGMERFVSRSDAAWFGYLSDAEDFYEKGPGFAGSDITYKMADVLLDDFFRQVEAKRAGTSDLGAELRFSHAEEIIPLAALMGLPGSTEPAEPGEAYTYADNPWRGADVSPLGANIQWDVFAKGDRYLVRMLYNEKETPFKAGCRPVAEGSAFYDLDELERCFGRG
ncbi:histidine-type phosphatase [Streptomyces sp. SCL15-4]|uniref:histidine-type phosphatase n=1 Tax=Streptomyces sp. SCL15-4 TaxID=2967221 RepID=UPI002966B416|nr:histidine-type phosphatase [Streptomyces sp. SCL15-4]